MAMVVMVVPVMVVPVMVVVVVAVMLTARRLAVPAAPTPRTVRNTLPARIDRRGSSVLRFARFAVCVTKQRNRIGRLFIRGPS